jgi:hypothetical protein
MKLKLSNHFVKLDSGEVVIVNRKYGPEGNLLSTVEMYYDNCAGNRVDQATYNEVLNFLHLHEIFG